MNLLLNSSKPDPNVIARIKDWAREVFRLPDDFIMVTELRRKEDSCPEVETVIDVLGEPGKARHHKLPKSAAEVLFFDVLSLAARGTHG